MPTTPCHALNWRSHLHAMSDLTKSTRLNLGPREGSAKSQAPSTDETSDKTVEPNA